MQALSSKLLNVVQAAPLRGSLRYEAGACHLVVYDHLHRVLLYQAGCPMGSRIPGHYSWPALFLSRGLHLPVAHCIYMT